MNNPRSRNQMRKINKIKIKDKYMLYESDYFKK